MAFQDTQIVKTKAYSMDLQRSCDQGQRNDKDQEANDVNLDTEVTFSLDADGECEPTTLKYDLIN